jgi:hypothetical protein
MVVDRSKGRYHRRRAETSCKTHYRGLSERIKAKKSAIVLWLQWIAWSNKISLSVCPFLRHVGRCLGEMFARDFIDTFLRPVMLDAEDSPRHPNLYDRITAAGIKPSYERPAPPSVNRRTLALGIPLAGMIVLTMAAARLGPR